MSWLIGFLIAFLVIDTVANCFTEHRLGRVEAQLVAFRAQFSELPAMRSTTAAALSNTAACAEAIDKLQGQQSSLGHDVTAQRMAIQALVVKLTDRPERQRFAPPPSSSGVRTKVGWTELQRIAQPCFAQWSATDLVSIQSAAFEAL